MLSETDTAPPEVNLTHLPFGLDQGIGIRANIGLVVLASDQTIEHEYRLLADVPGVAIYQSRIATANTISQENLRAMEARITQATDLLLPGLPMHVIGYGCTSASIIIGEERVIDLMKAARPDSLCTTPITAGRTAMAELGMKNIALLTPYTDDINDRVRGHFEHRGIGVPVMGSFNVEDDREACRIQPAAIRDAAIELGRHDKVDGVFVSCTSLRVAKVIQEIEDSLGKPATASNHAMAWHSLRLAGVHERRSGFGRLYRL